MTAFVCAYDYTYDYDACLESINMYCITTENFISNAIQKIYDGLKRLVKFIIEKLKQFINWVKRTFGSRKPERPRVYAQPSGSPEYDDMFGPTPQEKPNPYEHKPRPEKPDRPPNPYEHKPRPEKPDRPLRPWEPTPPRPNVPPYLPKHKPGEKPSEDEYFRSDRPEDANQYDVPDIVKASDRYRVKYQVGKPNEAKAKGDGRVEVKQLFFDYESTSNCTNYYNKHSNECRELISKLAPIKDEGLTADTIMNPEKGVLLTKDDETKRVKAFINLNKEYVNGRTRSCTLTWNDASTQINFLKSISEDYAKILEDCEELLTRGSKWIKDVLHEANTLEYRKKFKQIVAGKEKPTDIFQVKAVNAYYFDRLIKFVVKEATTASNMILSDTTALRKVEVMAK